MKTESSSVLPEVPVVAIGWPSVKTLKLSFVVISSPSKHFNFTDPVASRFPSIWVCENLSCNPLFKLVKKSEISEVVSFLAVAPIEIIDARFLLIFVSNEKFLTKFEDSSPNPYTCKVEELSVSFIRLPSLPTLIFRLWSNIYNVLPSSVGNAGFSSTHPPRQEFIPSQILLIKSYRLKGTDWSTVIIESIKSWVRYIFIIIPLLLLSLVPVGGVISSKTSNKDLVFSMPPIWFSLYWGNSFLIIQILGSVEINPGKFIM